MNKKYVIVVLLLFQFISMESFAVATEYGISYQRRKNTFDANNYSDSESNTGSISVYLWEQIALEMSYTKGYVVRGEKISTDDLQRTILQTTEIYGGDLILILAGRGSLLQPFIKGGVAKILRKQETKIEGQGTETLEPAPATIPSYGAGLKIALSAALKLNISYDVWQTPVTDTTKTDDTSLRIGLSLML